MQPDLCARISDVLSANASRWTGEAWSRDYEYAFYEALACLKLPGPDYTKLLRHLHHALKPKLYVEIGVRAGRTLALAHPDTHCIAIDPNPKLTKAPVNTSLIVATSDNFFELKGETARSFDLAFIDGDHSFEQVLRDFEHLERLAKPSSIICIHDVIPMDARSATPKAEAAFHTGDVWRLMADIVRQRTDLIAFTVACPPTGLGIIGRFKGLSIPSVCGPGAGFPSTWGEQVAALNIIPNDGRAIAAAFQGVA